MILHTDLKSRRWPWLTEGWEVAEDVVAEQSRLAARQALGLLPPEGPLFLDISPGIFTPADRVALRRDSP